VCSQPFDHTSVLQFLEKWTGVPEPNITAWRRQTFGDLTAAFRFDQAATEPPTLPDTSGPLALAHFASTTLPAPAAPNDQRPPAQEKGTRKRVGGTSRSS
jgi:phospholipase C